MELDRFIEEAAAGSEVLLPGGEYEGPLIIDKPLTVAGNNTTVWTRNSPAIIVKAHGVTLKNLRAERADIDENDLNGPSRTAVKAEFACEAEQVEIFGKTEGFGAEDGDFLFPKNVRLGDFRSGEENTFLIKIFAAEEAEIICGIRELSFEPSALKKGANDVKITAAPLSAQGFLYAEVLLKSKFIRRMFVFGRPCEGAEKAEGKIISAAENAPKSEIIEQKSARAEKLLPKLEIKKGMRVPLLKHARARFSLIFGFAEMPKKMEVDPYIFLLDKNERAISDEGVVFFGNERSENGEAIYFPEDGRVEIDLDRVKEPTEKIVAAYSVYEGESEGLDLSAVKRPAVSVWTRDGERISFLMNITAGRTAVAFEFYKINGEWRAAAEGKVLSEGVAKLCEKYGILTGE